MSDLQFGRGVRKYFKSKEKEEMIQKEKILIVDDMELHLETAVLYLEKSGYKMFTASDIKSAWRLVTEEEPDIILLDVVMPGESGLDLLSRVKSSYPQIGVIVMTSFGSEDVAAAAFKLGALDYIKKPLKYSDLKEVLEKTIQKQKQSKMHELELKTLKRAYADLQVSADSILQCMSSGVVAVDNNLCVRIINQKAKKILDAENRDIIGQYCYDAFPFLKKNSLIKSTLEKDRGLSLDRVEVPGAVGGTIVRINTDVIYDFDGNRVGAVAVFDDVTQLIKREEVLREREKLALIGQMAAGMAHELKNPLTSIRGFAQLLSGKSVDPVLSDYLKIVITEIDRMNQVIQDFLQLARPKSMEFSKKSINEVIREIIPMIEPQAFLKEIDVHTETDDSIPEVMIDPAHIKQVLLNLIQNSIEAMVKGGTLGIRTKYLKERNEIKLDISDTGCGIPAGDLNQIGVPFFSTKSGGTGLGLSISFNIVKKHRGRIEIESCEGSGTTFSILLPAGLN